MPPPSPSPAFHLRLLPMPYRVTQLPPNEPLPQKYIDALARPMGEGEGDGEGNGEKEKEKGKGRGKERLKMVSVTRTSEEVSIVEEAEEGLGSGSESGEGEGGEGKWRCVRILGPMAFDVVGVVNTVTAPIKAAGVGVFIVSTWDTDYVLVPREHVEKAVEAWKADGWKFVDSE